MPRRGTRPRRPRGSPPSSDGGSVEATQPRPTPRPARALSPPSSDGGSVEASYPTPTTGTSAGTLRRLRTAAPLKLRAHLTPSSIRQHPLRRLRTAAPLKRDGRGGLGGHYGH